MGLADGWIVSIVLGSILVFLLIVGIVLWIMYVRKKKGTRVVAVPLKEDPSSNPYDHARWEALLATIDQGGKMDEM